MTTNAPPAKAKRERKHVKPQWLDRDQLCVGTQERRTHPGGNRRQGRRPAGAPTTTKRAGDWGCDLGTVVSPAAPLDCQPADLMHDEGREAFAKLTAALSAA